MSISILTNLARLVPTRLSRWITVKDSPQTLLSKEIQPPPNDVLSETIVDFNPLSDTQVIPDEVPESQTKQTISIKDFEGLPSRDIAKKLTDIFSCELISMLEGNNASLQRAIELLSRLEQKNFEVVISENGLYKKTEIPFYTATQELRQLLASLFPSHENQLIDFLLKSLLSNNKPDASIPKTHNTSSIDENGISFEIAQEVRSAIDKASVLLSQEHTKEKVVGKIKRFLVVSSNGAIGISQDELDKRISFLNHLCSITPHYNLQEDLELMQEYEGYKTYSKSSKLFKEIADKCLNPHHRIWQNSYTFRGMVIEFLEINKSKDKGNSRGLLVTRAIEFIKKLNELETKYEVDGTERLFKTAYKYVKAQRDQGSNEGLFGFLAQASATLSLIKSHSRNFELRGVSLQEVTSPSSKIQVQVPREVGDVDVHVVDRRNNTNYFLDVKTSTVSLKQTKDLVDFSTSCDAIPVLVICNINNLISCVQSYPKKSAVGLNNQGQDMLERSFNHSSRELERLTSLINRFKGKLQIWDPLGNNLTNYIPKVASTPALQAQCA